MQTKFALLFVVQRLKFEKLIYRFRNQILNAFLYKSKSTQ